ncbi:MAG: hypothetical protein R3B57_07425 [Phycisphaerales bacterium]
MTRRPTHAPSRILAGAALALAALAAGCNIVGPAFLAIHGPEKVGTVYQLDHTKTGVVFVDDPASRVAQRRLRTQIGAVATQDLLDKKVVLDMIDTRSIMTVSAKDRHGSVLSMQELGEAVGADFIIHALVTEFTLSADGVSNMPTATLQVRVYDVLQQKTVWPSGDGEMYPLTIQARNMPGFAPQGDERLAAEGKLADQLGLALAQLFYKHEITEDARH